MNSIVENIYGGMINVINTQAKIRNGMTSAGTPALVERPLRRLRQKLGDDHHAYKAARVAANRGDGEAVKRIALQYL